MDINGSGGAYINADEALRRVGGNVDLYKRLLKRFLDGNEIETLNKAFQDGEMEEAARLVHTIKGVSANLSLARIKAASEALELAIRSGLDCSAAAGELRQVYNETVDKIVEYIG